jgi:antitoxin (DNA-binding transcriptional repressor) of toxin-antitoxin stability system
VKTISKRELNQQTAQVLDAVSEGHAVIVTERGVPRWRIEAIEGSGDPVARLRSAGRITPAKAKPAPWPVAKPRYTASQVDALFAESRGER